MKYRIIRVTLMLISMGVGYVQLSAAYLIFSGRFAILATSSCRNMSDSALAGVFQLIITGLLLFFWPIYVASQEWKWRKRP